MEKLAQLIELIDKNEVKMSMLIWSSICQRLLLDGNNKRENPRQLKREKEKIACDSGVETSNVYDGEIESMFDKSMNSHFRLKNEKGGFIIFDFKEKKISLTRCYLSVPQKNWNGGRPVAWKIEGPND